MTAPVDAAVARVAQPEAEAGGEIILLDPPRASDTWEAIEELVLVIPPPETIADGNWVAVQRRQPTLGWLARVFSKKAPTRSHDVAVACTALLRCGYRDIHVSATGLACARP